MTLDEHWKLCAFFLKSLYGPVLSQTLGEASLLHQDVNPGKVMINISHNK